MIPCKAPLTTISLICNFEVHCAKLCSSCHAASMLDAASSCACRNYRKHDQCMLVVSARTALCGNMLTLCASCFKYKAIAALQLSCCKHGFLPSCVFLTVSSAYVVLHIQSLHRLSPQRILPMHLVCSEAQGLLLKCLL